MNFDFSLVHTIFAFLVALSVLIAFHELGHYFVARLCNVKVLRFSLGMGKVLFSRRFGADQTEWVISALPLGGYVKMLDVREQDAEKIAPADLEREFTRQSVWKRMAIVAAGPLANFLLAIILFSVLFMVGVPEPVAKLGPPAVSTPAYQAGIRGDERVVAVNGEPVELWSDLRWKLLQLALDKQPVTLTVVSTFSTQPHQVTFATNQLSAEDLQANFLNKLGLDLAFPRARLGNAKPDSPATRAGLEKGDTVISIDGKNIPDALALIETVRAAPNKLLHFRIERSGVLREFSVTPDAVMEEGKAEGKAEGKLVGKLNVEVRSMPDMQIHQDSLLTAVKKATSRTWDTSVLILKTLAKMVVGEVSVKNLTGPITLADYAGQSAKIGLISYISFLAFISISLGVMNLLPIPVLDGGHLLYYALEVFTGHPVSPRFWGVAQRAGIAMLMLLMAVAFFNDIIRLLHS